MEARIRNILQCIIDQKPDDFNIETADKLVTDGIIDSIDLMRIISELSDEFGIEFDYEDITEENFNSINGIEHLVKELISKKNEKH